MNYQIETKGLTKKFGRFTAVDSMSLCVEQREIYGFLGVNGAGKTTAIRMLCGLLKPSSGEGRVAGLDVHRESERIRERIGYVSQAFSLYRDLTVYENMKLYGTLYGLSGGRLRSRIDEVCGFLSMDEIKKRDTRGLPWGWQQRLALGCAILHEPDVLFLDEPTGSVDPVARRMFWRFIQKYSMSGKTVFVTTHHMDEAEYCDRVSLMVAGRIAEQGKPKALKQRFGCSSLGEVFIKVMKR